MKLCLYKNSEINEKKIYKTPSLPRAIKEGDYEKKRAMLSSRKG